jgi:hypothetical protein
MATLLAATAQAAADATAQDTMRAAAVVAGAVEAAVRHVAQLVLTAEVTFDRDVSRAAFAIETEARVTAARAARETVARADTHPCSWLDEATEVAVSCQRCSC